MDSTLSASVAVPPAEPPRLVLDSTGCQTCRELHVRCDRVLPTCGPCRDKGRQCRRTELKIKRVRGKGFSFAKAKWLKIPPISYHFYYETQDSILRELNGEEVQREDDALSPPSIQSTPPQFQEPSAPETPRTAATRNPAPVPAPTGSLEPSGWQSPAHALDGSHSAPPACGRLPLPGQQLAVPGTSSHQSTDLLPTTAETTERDSRADHGSPTDRFIIREHASEPLDRAWVLSSGTPWPHNSNDRLQNSDTDFDLIPQPIYSREPLLPFRDHEHAMLFRHYVHGLAKWLDLCDARRSFETIVPARAIHCPLLLRAILVFAMRHRTNTKLGDHEERAIQYQIQCVHEAKAAHDSEDMRMNGSFFAAIVILRVVQEMEVVNYNEDNQSYMSRLADLVQDVLNEGRDISGDHLRVTSFWVGLRQEIYIAATKKQPLRISFISPLFKAGWSLSDADDYEWANRAVAHCAFVLDLCFGPSQPPSPERWRELREWNSSWERMLPLSSQPIFVDGTDEDVPGVFPCVMYHNSCHVIGAQHHLLAKLMLLQHDPTVPYAGSARNLIQDEIRRNIKHLVRRFCGMGQENDWTAPGMFTTCMAIAAFGEYFQDRRDQTRMLEILRVTQSFHARPTEKVRRKLLRIWGWAPQDWPADVSRNEKDDDSQR